MTCAATNTRRSHLAQLHARPSWLLPQHRISAHTLLACWHLISRPVQGEVRLRQGDTKGAVAAYERAAAESRTENAALLSGLTRVLIRDGRAPVHPCWNPSWNQGLWFRVLGLGFWVLSFREGIRDWGVSVESRC